MSEENTLTCASCGLAEIDDIKLMPCDDCDLVRYCSDDCKENHKLQHKGDCKKRAAELREELLFKQPESTHLGDCPICSLPLPLDTTKYFMMACCSKTICKGCALANQIRENEMRLDEHTCPFCREPAPDTIEENEKLRMKRIEANDPVAICYEGTMHSRRRDYPSALGYWSKAAELGDVEAHYKLSAMYYDGVGVGKDVEKRIHHLVEAAIGGHPKARYDLGCHEWENNNNAERAVKHFIIAATQGYDDAIKVLMKMFKGGFVSKEVLAHAFRAHKAAVDETKSPQREAAEPYCGTI